MDKLLYQNSPEEHEQNLWHLLADRLDHEHYADHVDENYDAPINGETVVKNKLQVRIDQISDKKLVDGADDTNHESVSTLVGEKNLRLADIERSSDLYHRREHTLYGNLDEKYIPVTLRDTKLLICFTE